DEISLTGDFKMISNSGEKLITPKSIGLDKLQASAISGGGTVKESAQIFENILKNQATPAQRSVVLANSAAALVTANEELTFIEALQIAGEALDSGKALKVFK